jgi:hypothetical protein
MQQIFDMNFMLPCLQEWENIFFLQETPEKNAVP